MPTLWSTLISSIDRDDKIPALSVLTSRLTSLLQSPETYYIDEVASLISADQSLSANIIRLVNSPAFSFVRRITELRDAVTFLGARRIFELVTAIPTIDFFSQDHRSYDISRLWIRSYGCATLSKYIGTSLNISIPSERLYMMGLLHDVGIPLLIKYVPDRFSKIIQVVERGFSLHDVERRYLGFTHCDVGYYAARKMNLYTEVLEAIKWHHEPERSTLARDGVIIISFSSDAFKIRSLYKSIESAIFVDISENSLTDLMKSLRKPTDRGWVNMIMQRLKNIATESIESGWKIFSELFT